MRTQRLALPAAAILLLAACDHIRSEAGRADDPPSLVDDVGSRSFAAPARLDDPVSTGGPAESLFPADDRDDTHVFAAFTADADVPADDRRADAPRGDAPRREKPNRLGRSNSPYLLAHAHNPVDWHPWGPEALELARRENKPIFLSVGYSSCYWCHVMERLVFSNEAIARKMNDRFINVKVDREERPDVDEVYMTSLQIYFALTRTPQPGGWPLSMFLTPDGKPFRGGTYFPPEDMRDEAGQVVRPAFTRILDEVADAWKNDRDTVEQHADTITEQVRRVMQPQFALEPAKIDRELLATTAATIKEAIDPVHGGVDFNADAPDAPKFPVAPRLALLQYQADRQGDKEAAEAVARTLDAMAAGGIRDHLGGGFHRYSVDRRWHVPHFEKMLYDQAQLATVYTAAFRATGNRAYRAVAEQTLDFVLREMTGPRGGFHSAIDAETDAVEGAYYTWTPRQVEDALGPRDAELFGRVYGLDEPKGLEHGHVLHLPRPLELVARDLSTAPSALERKLAEMRRKLLAARQERQPPLQDDKVLAGWNGLMIRALAEAGHELDRPEYVAAAERAALFLLAELRDDDGRLMRSWRNERGEVEGYLDDYAYVVQGLLAVHRATDEAKWLNAARRLTDDQIRLFLDEQDGGFYFTANDHEELIARTKNAYDDALPAANSVTVRNLLRIASHFDAPQYRELAERTLAAFVPLARKHPGGMSTLALAGGEFLDEPDFRAAREAPRRVPANGVARPARLVAETGADDPNAPAETPIVPIAGEERRASNEDDEDPLVKARAYLAVDRLPAGEECRIVVLLDVAEGWHINQNPAKPANFIPTQFTIKAAEGTKLSAVRYPKGDELRIAGFDDPVFVYEGRVAVYGVLTAPAEAAGKTEEFELTIRYQACNEGICRPPATVKLTGKVPIADRGEAVRAINEKLFREMDEKGEKEKEKKHEPIAPF
ncbi:MAG: DUF255 domain-containing protein [Planctomycetaceae bacterium]